MKKILAFSCVIIMLCTTVIVGASYALFNETISVGNHLQAGNLDADLTRTNLKYAVLDADGVLKENEDGEDEEITNMFMKTAAFFKFSQVEKTEEKDKNK